jgi:tRNA(Phe) wybutosine-synthesizing methylase Tyw3
MKSDHPTKTIAIKKASVDEMMIPLINWLNSYESIYTTYCCQGDKLG